MTDRNDKHVLDPEFLILAYRHGFFPMADSMTGAISWYCPDPRAIIPLSFKPSRSLRRVVRKGVFQCTLDTAFSGVIGRCARRADTWISEEIIHAYIQLHTMGFAHSVESWSEGALVGGLYGVAIGGAFFGESMFSKAPDASKVAFVHLVEHLMGRGFVLLDSQFINEHVKQFGAIEISRASYMEKLAEAVSLDVTFL